MMRWSLLIFVTCFYVLTIGYNCQVCHSTGCSRLADELKKIMNTSINPCTDFSGYVCGNYDKAFQIPAGEIRFSAFTEIGSGIKTELKDLLETQSVKNKASAKAKAAIFYRSCLDMEQRNAHTTSAIKKLLSNFNSSRTIEDSVISLSKYTTSSRIFSFSTDADPKNTGVFVLMLGRPESILDVQSLGNPGSDVGRKEIAAYKKLMETTLNILGLWNSERDVIDKIIQLQSKIAEAIPSVADQSNPDLYYNAMTIEEMEKKCSVVSWSTIVNGILRGSGKQVPKSSKIVVYSSPYLDKICNILKEYLGNKEKEKILLKDLEWAAISSVIALGSDKLVKARDDFISETLGTKGNQPLWNRCLDMTSQTMVDAVGHLYVKAKFQPEQKSDIEQLLLKIRGAFRDVLKRLDWMDEKTRATALTKVDSVKYKIGYPDSLLNETLLDHEHSSIQINADTFMENYINFISVVITRKLKRMNERVPDDDWLMGPHEVNAYYNPPANEIVFPAAILRYPFYTFDIPVTSNYGGIGMVIAHEVLHGFDTQGSMYDATGLLKEWWTPATRQKYKERSQCILDQYGNYTIFGQNLPSKQTIGEDIADNAGIRMAYKAAFLNESKPKLMLPGLNFTPEQLFFIQEGRVWCSLYTREGLLQKMKADVHTVWKYRINGPLSNMQEFSNAFKCRASDEMNRKNKCLVF